MLALKRGAPGMRLTGAPLHHQPRFSNNREVVKGAPLSCLIRGRLVYQPPNKALFFGPHRNQAQHLGGRDKLGKLAPDRGDALVQVGVFALGRSSLSGNRFAPATDATSRRLAWPVKEGHLAPSLERIFANRLLIPFDAK